MKIVHVTQFLGIGGLEKIIFHLIIEQNRLGHDVALYVYDHDQEWVPFFESNGIKVIKPTLKKPGIDPTLLLKMNRDLMNYDVVHTHDMNPIVYLGPLFFIRKLLILKSPRFIHTTHGLSHLDKVSKYIYFEKYLTPLAEKVICVSQKIAKFYEEELHFSKKKVLVIENGIKTFDGDITKDMKAKMKKWICDKHGLDINKPIILCLSRILPLKDQLFVINCLNKRPHYQVLIVGPASDQVYFQNLKEAAQSNITFTGSQEEIDLYNIGSDLFVSASTHEGIPVSVLEAMAHENPCVVSNIPGHKTLNQYGNFINLFELNSSDEFLNFCDQILSLPRDNVKLNESRKIVESNYSVKKMVKEYLESYLSKS